MLSLIAALVLAGVPPVTTCEQLARLTLRETTIEKAEAVAGSCRVSATVRPAPDSEIRIELWMPDERWNGKLLGIGNGAWGGAIAEAALADGVRRGFAAAASDTGHQGPTARFALGHPEKLKDFADRAIHEMAVKAKVIVEAYYGAPAKRAYFSGCSTGGRQALTEAQRFPADFDGIVAGAPGNFTSRQAFGQVWIAQAAQRTVGTRAIAAKLPIVHDAVLKACDAKDGVADGVLENPTRCAFDPHTIECVGPERAQCLTREQADAVATIYDGARTTRTGEQLFPGLERGGELGWARWWGAQPADYATDFFKFIVFGDPAWDFRSLDFDSDLAAVEEVAGTIDAIDPQLGSFFSRGGKLLLYAGWSDPGIAPRNVIGYFQRVRAATGTQADAAMRLFMVPGMAHCGGGDGTSSFDMLAVLDDWIERGATPERILARRVRNGTVDRTRPLCPYPQGASFTGSGGSDDAASFVCRD